MPKAEVKAMPLPSNWAGTVDQRQNTIQYLSVLLFNLNVPSSKILKEYIIL